MPRLFLSPSTQEWNPYNGGGNKNAAISVMKTNGKGYRVVSKYFQW